MPVAGWQLWQMSSLVFVIDVDKALDLPLHLLLLHFLCFYVLCFTLPSIVGSKHSSI
jgi:hypothetical protein